MHAVHVVRLADRGMGRGLEILIAMKDRRRATRGKELPECDCLFGRPASDPIDAQLKVAPKEEEEEEEAGKEYSGPLT